MKVILKEEEKKEKEELSGLMELFIKGTFIEIKLMDKEYMRCQESKSTQENGKME